MKKWIVIGAIAILGSLLGQGIAGFAGNLIGGLIGVIAGYVFYYKFMQ